MVAETVEQRQSTPMTMLEVVSDPDYPGTESGRLGNRAMRLVKITEENGTGPEGDDGATGGLRTAREEVILHENHDSLCSSPGLAEIQKEEEQIHDGNEIDLAGKYKLDSVLSVGVGDGRDEGEQGNESLSQAEYDVGLGEIEAPSKGLKMQEVNGEVDEVGCENELREEGEGVNILALVSRLDEVLGGSEMLDVQPLAVMEKDLGDVPMSTDWVFERIRGFCKVVGISCPGFEDKLMDLFNVIEAHRYSDRVRHDNNLSAMGNRGQREVKSLECSVNYDGKGGQSSRLTRKGRVGNC
jgi:hypothetical protein